jgi:hypothetical protein
MHIRAFALAPARKINDNRTTSEDTGEQKRATTPVECLCAPVLTPKTIRQHSPGRLLTIETLDGAAAFFVPTAQEDPVMVTSTRGYVNCGLRPRDVRKLAALCSAAQVTRSELVRLLIDDATEERVRQLVQVPEHTYPVGNGGKIRAQKARLAAGTRED